MTNQPATSTIVEPLLAAGPSSDVDMSLFGRMVGSWELDWRGQLDGETREAKGEWHFGWTLEGRAVQDVWIVPRRGEPEAGLGYGTTIRYPDPALGAWRVTWINPKRGMVHRFHARDVDGEIVMESVDEDAGATRWVFSDITPDSFTWRGIESNDGGTTWRVDEEMSARRIRA